MAQYYNYSYTKMEFGSSFQKNLISLRITLDWGLDDCALWRKDNDSCNKIALGLACVRAVAQG